MIRLLLPVLILGGACLPGCVPTATTDPTPYREDAWVDPVCGEIVKVASPWRGEYGGRRFYFHSAECRRRFYTAPEAFVTEDQQLRAYVARRPLPPPEDVHDPVCGRPVDVSTPWRGRYGPDTFFFHSEECRRRFLENPQAFAEGMDRQRPSEAR